MRTLLLLPLIACSASDDTELPEDTSTEIIAEEPGFLPYAEDGESVEEVDAPRYLGLWYEIATTPSQQQSFCSGTTAKYSLADDGENIDVVNRCYVGGLDGNRNRANAIARPLDDTYARLMVDFGYGFEAPYTIIELYDDPSTDEYSYAAVSSNGVSYWILSRTPQMPTEMYDQILDRIDERGGDSSRLIETEQPIDSEL